MTKVVMRLDKESNTLEVSSIDTVFDGIYSFDFEESTISKDELYQRLKGGAMTVCFYTITE